MTTPIQPQPSSTELATIAPEPEKILAGELRDVIDVIRRDLPGDAIDTDATLKRYLKTREIVERVAALQEGDAKRELLKRPGPMAKYLMARYGRLDQEVMGAVYLDVRNRLIVASEIFRGTLVRVTVEPRPILREALEHGAASLVPNPAHGGLSEPQSSDFST
jgi:DNA repair protein RadC